LSYGGPLAVCFADNAVHAGTADLDANTSGRHYCARTALRRWFASRRSLRPLRRRVSQGL